MRRLPLCASALAAFGAVIALSSSALADDAKTAPSFYLTLHGGIGNELSAGAFAELRIAAGLYGGSGFFLARNFSGTYGTYSYYSVPIQVGYRIEIGDWFEIRPLAGARIMFSHYVDTREDYDITGHDPIAFSGGIRGNFVFVKTIVLGVQVDVTPYSVTWDQTCIKVDCGIHAIAATDVVGKPEDHLQVLVHASAVAGILF